MVYRRRGRRAAKKGGRKPRRVMRRGVRRVNRRLANSEFASASQTLKLVDDSMNGIIRLDNINLSQFDRMVQIAQAYQYFRITRVEYKLTPYADTYQTSGFDGTGSAEPHSSVPYLYWLINKGENLVVNSFNAIRDAGAKPIRFDDKSITLRWKPAVNVLTRSDDSAPPNYNFAIKKISPWLATNNAAGQNATTWTASTVPHMGLLYGVEQDYVVGPEGYENKYGNEITVHFQFKKPLNAPGKLDDTKIAVSKDLSNVQ